MESSREAARFDLMACMTSKRALARRTHHSRFIRTPPHTPSSTDRSSNPLGFSGPVAIPSAALFTANEPSASTSQQQLPSQFDKSPSMPSSVEVNMSTDSAFPVSASASGFNNWTLAGPANPATSRHAAAERWSPVPATTTLGTGSPPFVRTAEDPASAILDGITRYYVSICAMPAYASKSPEELRCEDYSTKRKNAGTATSFALFDQSSGESTSSTSPTLFGTLWPPPVLPVMPSIPNGFGFGPSPAPSGDFGAGELFQNHAPTFGTGYPRFCVFEGIDTYGGEYRTVKYHSICAMPAYRNKSPEQLRYEDYLKMQNCLLEAA
ncbi:hypothetical protein FI667_g10668, partial [Globisporangium splendens]